MSSLYTDSLDDAAIVARASGHKPGDARWTVLTICAFASERLAVEHGAIGGRFVAEIVGETRIVGEERRLRRASFPSLKAALGWIAFDQKTTLFGELRNKAIAWIEAQSGDGAPPKTTIDLPFSPADVIAGRAVSPSADSGQRERKLLDCLGDAVEFIEHIAGQTGYPDDEAAREEYDAKIARYRSAAAGSQ